MAYVGSSSRSELSLGKCKCLLDSLPQNQFDQPLLLEMEFPEEPQELEEAPEPEEPEPVELSPMDSGDDAA